ncbi:hypothetical protein [Pseudomonas granadensis]|uniref:hypothetical protein n=1 Tax=Pseudomonas granadensis TaxID=1421430 RepID=UPI00087BD794|nr:hypothetical protein [Pseudomonas granadensis]SDT54425.1 hypothetical protein SAMN05216579_4420 [Pseudomonas granadensis]
MRKNTGPLRPSPTPETPGPSTPRPAVDMDFHLSGRPRTGATGDSPRRSADGATDGALQAETAVTVTRMSEIVEPLAPVRFSSLERYRQNALSALSAHDAQGLRTYKGRKFADVSDDATTALQTVMVVYHEMMKAYRARLSTEREASGPPLYRIGESNTWSLHRPFEYYDPRRYIQSHIANSRGYYSVEEIRLIEHSGPAGKWFERQVVDRNAGLAFVDENGGLIRVDPNEARGDISIPVKLALWSDGEIWSTYRLEGARSLVFRSEAEAAGKAPDWATRFNEPNTHKFLTDSLKWSCPDKSQKERTEILRSYNLSIAQQNRLRLEMEHGTFPEWAEQHKRSTQSTSDETRFAHIAEELEPFSLKLREQGENHEHDLPPLAQRYDEKFLNDYLEYAGYKRNQHDYLYRTDIPAMFRADLRTPFELARDKRLVKLRGNPSESTTKRAFSATFGVANALSYMGFDYYSNPRHYNSQANRYPGHFSDSDSSSGFRHSSGEESDTSFKMDETRDYPLLRRGQHLGFVYVIDTRNIEVVPRVENMYLNNRDFDGDTLEGRISMPTRGISAERIWLVSSDLNRAARVEDVFLQAGDRAEAIEKATWAGANDYDRHGNHAYDRLIDEIDRSGGVVLKLPKGRGTSSNDVTWPVAEHYRA